MWEGLIQSVEGLKSKKLTFSGKEWRILLQKCNMEISWISSQSVCPLDFRYHPHDHMNQFLKINQSLYIHTHKHTHIYIFLNKQNKWKRRNINWNWRNIKSHKRTLWTIICQQIQQPRRNGQLSLSIQPPPKKKLNQEEIIWTDRSLEVR